MKICVLNDPDWGGFDPGYYLTGYDWEMVDIHKATAVIEVRALAKRGFDIVFNLCDGAWDEDRPGIEVVEALQKFNVPFTGAGPEFYEPTREMMKQVCHYWGIQAPAGVFVSNLDNLDQAIDGLRYPLLVKHPNSYASVGLTRESCVNENDSLILQVGRMIDSYGGALIEEFIEGREFSVLVVENPDDRYNPKAYLPIEILFPPGETFKHENLKWVDYEKMKCIPVDDMDLAERLKDMAKKLFVGLNGSGYGRCDILMNEQGELFMLEINPNGAVFYPPDSPGMADFILQFDPAGHEGFVKQLIAAGFTRHARLQKKWNVRFQAGSGYGMYAVAPIDGNEMIEPFEEQPHSLVSKNYIFNRFDEEQRERFFRHAYPLTEEVWVTPGIDPLAWKPINHSCDPNAWFSGLDLIARREIEPGEQITIDYATLFADDMPAFDCTCGSVNCRGTVRGTDYLEPFVRHYGDHVSDYVRMKRAGLMGK
jgi:D-alanine-D-alanine ligase-like ATP-grasp enzyme